MADVESDQSKKICRSCKKSFSSGLCCGKCKSIYHTSCGQIVKLCCSETISDIYTKPLNEIKDTKPHGSDQKNCVSE